MLRPKDTLKTIAILAAYFSVLPICVLNFGAAFREEIEIVNKTSRPISVTPIGIWHASKTREVLPVIASRVFQWTALKDGDFSVGAGESIRINYDGDDIDPTEIYVNAGPARLYEVSVKQRSAADFDYDKDRRIEITDLSKLPAASAIVTAAALGANKNEWKVAFYCMFVFGPMVFSAGLWILSKLLETSEAKAIENAHKS